MSMKVDFGSTFGALFVGFSLSCVIFGILSIQAFTYFRRFPNDLAAYKALVASIWILETLDQVLIGHAVYVYIISDFGDLLSIIDNKIIWSLVIQTSIESFVGMIVKSCFAMRVWRFSNRNVAVTGTILLLVFATFAVAVLFTYESGQLSSILLVSQIKTYGTIALAAGLATDVLTSLALCFFLHRLRTGHKQSDSLVNTLTIYAVNTGGVTSAISLTTLLLYNLLPNTFYFMASFFCLGKVYAISLLCTLHTRKMVRGRGTDNGERTTAHGSTFYLVDRQGRSSFYAAEPQSKSVQIGIQQEISVVTDENDPECLRK